MTEPPVAVVDDVVAVVGRSGDVVGRGDDIVVARPAAWKQWLRLLLALSIIGVVVVLAGRSLAAQQQDIVGLAARAEPWRIVVAALSLLFVMVGNGVVLRELVARFGVVLDVKSWLGITFVASMLNFVSPISGAGAMRGVYLKRVHGLPYTAFAAVVATSFVFSVASSAGLGAASLIALDLPGGRAAVVAVVACGALLLLPLLLALLPLPAERAGDVATDDKSLKARLLRLVGGFRGVARDRGLLLRLALINVVTVVLHGVAFVMAFRIAGFEGSFWVPLTSSAFARIGTLFAITPAGLGIYEAFGAVSAQLVGVSAGPALLGVLVVRVLSSIISIAGGLCFSPLLVRFKSLNRPAPRAGESPP